MNEHWICVGKQSAMIKKLAESEDAEFIKDYASNDAFTWAHFLETEGLCPADEPNKCLCDELLGIDPGFEKRWAEITNKEEI